jgi:hypothetical protein
MFDIFIYFIIRKLSRSSSKSSLPPSYSTADLHTLAMSVQDYLYPPPDYKEIYRSAHVVWLTWEEGVNLAAGLIVGKRAFL